MRSLFAAAMIFLSSQAFASRYECKANGADLAVNFDGVYTDNVTVELSSDGRSHDGRCAPLVGAEEAFYNCTIFTSTDSGYYLTLESDGSPSLHSTVQHWTMQGVGLVTVLPCSEVE